MHEWALAEAVVKTVLKIAEENRFKKIIEVNIKIGEMQQIEYDVFKSILSQLKPARLKNTVFKIEVARTEFRCRICGQRWFFDNNELEDDVREAIHFLPEVSHAYVRCPGCGSPDFEIIGGRGVWVESVKGVVEDG
ncbi:MAG: hydrogenase nickel incorporation protein HypA [Thermoproteota archaeon]